MVHEKVIEDLKDFDNWKDFKRNLNYIEEKNMNKIESLGINSNTTYLDPSKGYKIAKYIEGAMLTDDCSLEDVTSTLKKLHDSEFLFDNNYDHLERLASYEKIHTNNVEEYQRQYSTRRI